MNEYDDGFDVALSMIENLVEAAREDETNQAALEAYEDVHNMINQLREVGTEDA